MRELTGLEEDALQQAYWAPRHDYDRGALSGVAYWQAVSPRAADPAIAAQLIAADTELWTAPNQPMIDWALALQRAGIRTGILSNLGDSMTEGVLARFPWLESFHHRTWSHALNLAKPDPEIYAHAAAGLETEPSYILFLDDREVNIAAAHAARMQTLLYTTHDAFVDEMKARGFAKLLYPSSLA